MKLTRLYSSTLSLNKTYEKKNRDYEWIYQKYQSQELYINQLLMYFRLMADEVNQKQVFEEAKPFLSLENIDSFNSIQIDREKLIAEVAYWK